MQGNIWFTSDYHFGCDNLVKHERSEFATTEEHDSYLLDATNRVVDRNDTLVIIGDFCKEKPGRYRPKIRCRHIFFVLGNHDGEAKIKAVFGGNVWTRKIVKIAPGVKVLCDHHPSCFWDGSHKGWYHAYGHIHHKPRYEAMMDLGLPGRRSMDVSVIAAKKLLGDYRPFSAVEFLDYLKDRPGHDIIPEEERWHDKDYASSDGADADD